MKKGIISFILLSMVLTACGGNNKNNEHQTSSLKEASNTSEETLNSSEAHSQTETLQIVLDHTIGNSVPGYEYNYSLDMSATFLGEKLGGSVVGNTQYDSSSKQITLYDEHTSSGALSYAGSQYFVLQNNKGQYYSFNENGLIDNIENVSSDLNYDSRSFAKVLFQYEEVNLIEIRPTENDNEYQLLFKDNISSGISVLDYYIGHPLIAKIIKEVPSSNISADIFVKFDDDFMISYQYFININTSNIQFDASFNLNFKNPGAAPIINSKAFADIYTSKNDLVNSQNELSNYVNNYMRLEHSSYDFSVDTSVGFVGKPSIDAKITGFTKRKIDATDEVYYLNDLNVVTDYQNDELYGTTGLKNCHAGRVKLAMSKDVHLIRAKTTRGYTDVKNLGGYPYDEEHDFFMLATLEMNRNDAAFIEKNVSGNKIIYSVGSNKNANNLFEKFNNAIEINPLLEGSPLAFVFGSPSFNSMKLRRFILNYEIVNGVLSSIAFKMNGTFVTSFSGSRDYDKQQDASFSLNLSIKVTNDGASYEPSSSVEFIR
jgi:hypothetical protein